MNNHGQGREGYESPHIQHSLERERGRERERGELKIKHSTIHLHSQKSGSVSLHQSETIPYVTCYSDRDVIGDLLGREAVIGQ